MKLYVINRQTVVIFGVAVVTLVIVFLQSHSQLINSRNLELISKAPATTLPVQITPHLTTPVTKEVTTKPPQESANKAVAGTFKFVRQVNPAFKGLTAKEAMDRIHRHCTTFTAKCNQTKRYGRPGDGGYTACLDAPYAPTPNNCLVYSFGIRNEWSFDDDMYKELGCEVHSFDPSMSQRDHVRSEGVRFHQLGIWGSDIINEEGWNLMSLGTIIKFLGHENRVIDYLKIDVEGAEWPALQEMLAINSTRNVKQMIFEIHTPKIHPAVMNMEDFGQTMLDLEALQNQLGFRLYAEKHTNGCCGRFATLAVVPSGKNKIKNLCCYELFYVNSLFLSRNQ